MTASHATPRSATIAEARSAWHSARPGTAMAILARAGSDMIDRRAILRSWGVSFDDQIDYSADSFLADSGFGPDGDPVPTHTAAAEAIARETGWDLDGEAEAHGWAAVATGPVGRSRDSEALELSNWEVIYADLVERFGSDVIDTAHFGHWACGWIDEIIWDAGRTDVAEAVEAWRTALADYPVADEMHYSSLEWDMNHPAEGECYSDDPECSCETNLTHLEALDGAACQGDNFTPRNLTGDTAEITCEACLAETGPRYAALGQLDFDGAEVAA